MDLDAERICVVNAGHLPPLVAPAGGEAALLPVAGGLPLGVDRAARATSSTTFDLPAGSAIVLVTDGAVEVRGEAVDAGLERLRALVAGEHDLERLCDDRGERRDPRRAGGGRRGRAGRAHPPAARSG